MFNKRKLHIISKYNEGLTYNVLTENRKDMSTVMSKHLSKMIGTSPDTYCNVLFIKATIHLWSRTAHNSLFELFMTNIKMDNVNSNDFIYIIEFMLKSGIKPSMRNFIAAFQYGENEIAILFAEYFPNNVLEEMFSEYKLKNYMYEDYCLFLTLLLRSAHIS
jgi:hypothetical protein